MIDKYLKILDLNRSTLNKESLKRAYRRLANKFHPDHIMESGLSDEEANAKMKEINEAYEKLSEYLKAGRVNYSQSESSASTYDDMFEVRRYRVQTINRIKNLIDGAEKLEYDIEKYYDDMLLYVLEISDSRSKSEIDKLLSLFGEKYSSMLKYIKSEFFRENFISFDIEENLNYKLSVKEFMAQLDSLKVKHSKSYQFNLELDEKIEKFKLYVYYSDLKEIIDSYRAMHFEEAKKNDFINVSGKADEFEDAIKALFDDYTKVCKRVNELLGKCKSIFGEDVVTRVSNIIGKSREKTLVERILNVKNNYAGISDRNNQLLDDLFNELVKEEEFKKKVSELRESEIEVTKRYKDAVVRDRDNQVLVNRFTHIYDIYKGLIEAVIQRKIDVSICFSLKDLSFSDYQADIDLITKQIMGVKGMNVYVAKDTSVMLNLGMPRVIVSFPNKKMLYKNDTETTFVSDISWEDKRRYVSLDELLKNCTFSGETVKNATQNERYCVLYNLKNSDYALVMRENGIIDLVNIGFCVKDSNMFEQVQFKDIEELKQYIVSQMLGSNFEFVSYNTNMERVKFKDLMGKYSINNIDKERVKSKDLMGKYNIDNIEKKLEFDNIKIKKSKKFR